MIWFVILGIIALVFGFLFIFSKEILFLVSLIMERPLASIEPRISSIRGIAGGILVLIALWILYTAVRIVGPWYLYLAGLIILLFGLLYLFIPRWVDQMSKFTNRVVFATDEVIVGGRRSIGIVLLILALYFFYTAFLVLK